MGRHIIMIVTSPLDYHRNHKWEKMHTSLIANPDSNRPVKDLNYSVAYARNGGLFVIIEVDTSRHPINQIKVHDNLVSWVNAKGVTEVIGLEYPLPAKAVELALTSELFISESDLKNGEIGQHVFAIRPNMLDYPCADKK